MESSPSPWLYEARADLRALGKALAVGAGSCFRFELRAGKKSLWAVVSRAGTASSLACRIAHAPGGRMSVSDVADEKKATRIDLDTDYGNLRVIVGFDAGRHSMLHWTTKFLPTEKLQLPFWPRDLYACGRNADPLQSSGRIHTTQRGLRTGIVFASVDEPANFTFFYLQNFSALCQYFDATRSSPADSVGGVWPELGYAAPASRVALPKSREVTIADAYLALSPQRCDDEQRMALLYFDLLAQVYRSVPHPDTTYHHWPDKAREALRDIAFSPQCTYERQGRRYAMPYVADETKPPESMVQFTVLHPAREYGAWAGVDVPIVRELVASMASFYDPKAGAVVRWLPGERFGQTSEAGQSHANMDSWYFYHTLFNVSRLAKEGDRDAKRLFATSLPLAKRIAKRFDYRWPVFFDIRTLEIARDETAPGKGGENDVAGLYALVMLQAYELFRRREYRAEAERAAATLSGLGFSLGYQMNTTGFAAEAMLRLWKLTGRQDYLEMSYLCMANMVDNMWIWECSYGWGKDYRTFFGLFPLREAPYLAAYEELEMVAKVHDYLNIGRDAIRPSVRFLLCEYVRYALDRAWGYYPAHLPAAMLAEKPRNGHIDRNLAIPLEDLQDGWSQSGQVGQEVYGSGCAFVMTSRHYRRVMQGILCYCDYPVFDFTRTSRGRGTGRNVCSFRLAGTREGKTRIRLIRTDPTRPLVDAELVTRVSGRRKRIKPVLSGEGHLEFNVRGDQRVELRMTTRKRGRR